MRTQLEASTSAWPEGIACAVSLSFDDGRESQRVLAPPLLEKYGIRATFYLTAEWLEGEKNAAKQAIIAQWRAIHAAGHEIGNHTINHPCTNNFPPENKIDTHLETMTLADMSQEIDGAQRRLESKLGVTAATFAYPCGMTYVGRGIHCQSYIPLIAERFVAGRTYNDECAAAPLRCDLARTPASRMDNRPFSELLDLVNQAIRHGDWLVFVAHSIVRESTLLSIEVPILEALLAHLAANKNIWVDTIENVGRHVQSVQKHIASQSKPAVVTLA